MRAIALDVSHCLIRRGDKKKQRGDRVVDARGALCPAPTVMAALALEKCPPLGIVDVLADDPTTRRDLPLWCAELGHTLVGLRDERKGFRLRIQKGGAKK